MKSELDSSFYIVVVRGFYFWGMGSGVGVVGMGIGWEVWRMG